jgi:hypothetical protein
VNRDPELVLEHPQHGLVLGRQSIGGHRARHRELHRFAADQHPRGDLAHAIGATGQDDREGDSRREGDERGRHRRDPHPPPAGRLEQLGADRRIAAVRGRRRARRPREIGRRQRDLDVGDDRLLGAPLEDILQLAAHLLGVARTPGRILVERTPDEVLEGPWDVGATLGDRRRLAAEDLCHQARQAVRLERRLASRHLLEDGAHRPDIDRRADARAPHVHLLGRHVLRGADHRIRAALGLDSAQLRDSEVEQDRTLAAAVVAGQEDVRRLEIAVDDAARCATARPASTSSAMRVSSCMDSAPHRWSRLSRSSPSSSSMTMNGVPSSS